MPRLIPLSRSCIDHEFFMAYADMAELVLDAKNWNCISVEYMTAMDAAVLRISGDLE